jgi:hypothetical protein
MDRDRVLLYLQPTGDELVYVRSTDSACSANQQRRQFFSRQKRFNAALWHRQQVGDLSDLEEDGRFVHQPTNLSTPGSSGSDARVVAMRATMWLLGTRLPVAYKLNVDLWMPASLEKSLSRRPRLLSWRLNSLRFQVSALLGIQTVSNPTGDMDWLRPCFQVLW